MPITVQNLKANECFSILTLLPAPQSSRKQSLAQEFFGEVFSSPLQVKQGKMCGPKKGHTTEMWVLGQLLNPMGTRKGVPGTQNQDMLSKG